METHLYSDDVTGTHIIFNGRDEVRVIVASVPFSQHTMQLDLDDVDRLLAVREHAVDPVLDIAEFFEFVHHCQPQGAKRAARAFVVAAPGLAETLR